MDELDQMAADLLGILGLPEKVELDLNAIDPLRLRDFAMRWTGPAPGCQKQAGNPEEWFLPATVLNVFWSDVLPRYIALIWSQKEVPWPAFGSDDLWCRVIDAIPQLTVNARSEFIDRVAILQAYDAQQEFSRPPFYFVGEGGYDFIVTDRGLDIFVPPRPPGVPLGTADDAFQAQMAHLYSHRSTGRLPIGLPSFLAPTGQAQYGMSLRPGAQMSAMTGASQVKLRVAELQPLADYLGVQVADLEDQAWQPTDHEGNSDGDPVVTLSLDCLICARAGSLRQWQVSGAVYRAVMEQLPRIVAEIWLGEVQGAMSSYEKVWSSPGDQGLREAIAERLETHLPPFSAMPSFHGPPDPTAVDLPWGADVAITPDGFHFPYHGPAPDPAHMLSSMVGGAAGNPVFTSSSMTT